MDRTPFASVQSYSENEHNSTNNINAIEFLNTTGFAKIPDSCTIAESTLPQPRAPKFGLATGGIMRKPLHLITKSVVYASPTWPTTSNAGLCRIGCCESFHHWVQRHFVRHYQSRWRVSKR